MRASTDSGRPDDVSTHLQRQMGRFEPRGTLPRWLAAVVRACRWPIVVTALHVGTLDLVCDHVFFAGDVPATVLTLQFLTALPFAFLVSSHRASLLALPAIFFVDGVAAYFVYAYQIDIRADTLAFAYETDLAEASAFVDPALLGVASLGFAVGAILARLSWADAGRYRWSRLVAVLVLLPVFELAEDDLRELKVPLTLPLQIVGESRVYWREKA